LAEEQAGIGGHVKGLAATLRKDNWWWEPLWTGLGFLAFALYANWAAYQGEHYFHENYLSPFYSPVLFTDLTAAGAAPVEHAWLGEWPPWLADLWPSFLPTSPAWLILAGPLLFRATCYYYRKFYYRSYFLSPPGCSVGGVPQKNYRGETFLLLVQNLHRYAWYIAVAYIVILGYDGWLSLWRDGELGFGVGSFILIVNPILLGMYTFGCHSCRHLVGGQTNQFSCGPIAKMRHGCWSSVTKLNERHMMWAWISMIWVGLTDVYVRLVSMGVITDFNTW